MTYTVLLFTSKRGQLVIQLDMKVHVITDLKFGKLLCKISHFITTQDIVQVWKIQHGFPLFAYREVLV